MPHEYRSVPERRGEERREEEKVATTGNSDTIPSNSFLRAIVTATLCYCQVADDSEQ